MTRPPTTSPRRPGSTPRRPYRLPGIEHGGVAQLSLLETALWPLKSSPHTSTYETTYQYTAAPGERRTGTVRVFNPRSLQNIDEFYLWGLLALTLQQPGSDATLQATPYWILKQLGMPIGGFAYRQLRDSLERLAFCGYQNDAFYNPLAQERERVAFTFFNTYIPTIGGRGFHEDPDRCWRIEWAPHFFAMCKSTGGSLLFDLDLFRSLSPAERRLFLKLHDRFWRCKRVFMNVDDLTINGLGMSANRPLYKRKHDLMRCMQTLLDREIIALGRGHRNVNDLFMKKAKSAYVVSLYEGPYFKQSTSAAAAPRSSLTDDPLLEPLRRIGFEANAIRRLLATRRRETVQRWIKITEAAMHEAPGDFPGFRSSPAAFCMNGIQNNYLPPDWFYQHEKRQRQQKLAQERRTMNEQQQVLRAAYDQERQSQLHDYVATEAKPLFNDMIAGFIPLYRAQGDPAFQQRARDAALAKIEAEHFRFPAFSVWMLNRLSHDD